MNLQGTLELYAGGPGSGCNPAVGSCGRPLGRERDFVVIGDDEKSKQWVKQVLNQLPEKHADLLERGNLLVYARTKATTSTGRLIGGYTESTPGPRGLPVRMVVGRRIGSGGLEGDMSKGMFQSMVTHEVGHALDRLKLTDEDRQEFIGLLAKDGKKLAGADGMSRQRLGYGEETSPKESLAEAYRLYVEKPQALGKVAPKLLEFFERKLPK